MMGPGGVVMAGRGMVLVHQIRGTKVFLVSEGMVVMEGAMGVHLAQVGIRGDSKSPQGRGRVMLVVEMMHKHLMEPLWNWCISLHLGATIRWALMNLNTLESLAKKAMTKMRKRKKRSPKWATMSIITLRV